MDGTRVQGVACIVILFTSRSTFQKSALPLFNGGVVEIMKGTPHAVDIINMRPRLNEEDH